MRALSIRQPFAELILRGVKTIEYRSRATKIIGERFWIYASRKDCRLPSAESRTETGIWSTDLSSVSPPPWMVELGEAMRLFGDRQIDLPRGVIVGSAIIDRCDELPADGIAEDASRGTFYRWHLGGVERLALPRVPRGRPQPVWFKPF